MLSLLQPEKNCSIRRRAGALELVFAGAGRQTDPSRHACSCGRRRAPSAAQAGLRLRHPSPNQNNCIAQRLGGGGRQISAGRRPPSAIHGHRQQRGDRQTDRQGEKRSERSETRRGAWRHRRAGGRAGERRRRGKPAGPGRRKAQRASQPACETRRDETRRGVK